MMRFNTQDDRVEIYDPAGRGCPVAGSRPCGIVRDAEQIAIQMAVVLG